MPPMAPPLVFDRALQRRRLGRALAGGYADWEKIRKQRQAGKPAARSAGADKPEAAAPLPPPAQPAKKGKLSYKDQRDY